MTRRTSTLFSIALAALSALFVLGVYAAQPSADRVALVIGNGDYRTFTPLPNPANDATAISEKLRELGFHVLELVDGTETELNAVVEDFGQAAAGSKISLVYFAGHGVQFSGENYLIPIDAAAQSPDELRASGLPLSRIYTHLRKANPELSVVILDACRNNPFESASGGGRGLSLANNLGSDTAVESDSRRTLGTLIAYAAEPGAVALDGTDGNSPYTTALLQWIDRPGLEIGIMFRRVRQTVIDLTEGKQVPWVEESLLGEVYLAGSDVPVSREADLRTAIRQDVDVSDPREQRAVDTYMQRLEGKPTAVGEIELASASSDRDGLVWLAVRNQTSPDAFRRFIDTFPQSDLVPLAEQKLAALATAAAKPAADPVGSQEPPSASAAAPTPDLPALELTDRSLLAEIQHLLALSGVYQGKPDGLIGPGSRQAISTYRERRGLSAEPVIDQTMLSTLVNEHRPILLDKTLPKERRQAFHRLAAIASSGADAKVETITVASFHRRKEIVDLWHETARRFEADNPGVRVEIRTLEGAAYKETLLPSLGSEDPPDVFYTFGGGHIEALARAGFARNLAPFAGDGLLVAHKPQSLANFRVDDGLYAIPIQLFSVQLWFNRAMLARAGVDPESLQTWDGFMDSVRRIREAGMVPLAIGAADEWPAQFYWGGLSFQNGGSGTIADALAGRNPAGFSGPAFVKAAEMLKQLASLDPFQPTYLSDSDIASTDRFAAGEAAMTLTGNWNLGRMRAKWAGGAERFAAEIGWSDVPRTGPVSAGTYGGIGGWAVNSRASEKAVAFALAFSAPDLQQALAVSDQDIPTVSSADDYLTSPTLADLSRRITAASHHQLYFDMMLGPEVGKLFNEVSVDLLKGDIEPNIAANTIGLAWKDHLKAYAP